MAQYNTQITVLESDTTNPKTISVTFPFTVVCVVDIIAMSGGAFCGGGVTDLWERYYITDVSVSGNTVSVTFTRNTADAAHKILYVCASG